MRATLRRPGSAGLLFCCALVAWLGFPLLQASAAEDPRSLRRIVYDYAVTSYCGLLTAEVEFGFQQELATVTRHSGLSEADAKAQRIAGWVDADREWSNRGLGGYRAWCKEEGIPAAEWFLTYWSQP